MKRPCGSAECARDGDSREVQLVKQPHLLDEVAFREIVEQLKSKIFSLSYALLGNASDADVAAQKVFVRLYRNVGPVGPQHNLIKFAYRLAIHQCCVELRLRRLRKFFGLVTRPASTSDPNGLPDKNRGRILVFQALSMLPDRERVLLVLREVADQTVEEIADIMQLDPATVRRRLFAARQRLRIRVQPS